MRLVTSTRQPGYVRKTYSLEVAAEVVVVVGGEGGEEGEEGRGAGGVLLLLLLSLLLDSAISVTLVVGAERAM